jgi:hypothetical protein
MLTTILLVFAFVLFAIAAAWNAEPYRYRLVAAGLACWSLAELVGHLPLR